MAIYKEAGGKGQPLMRDVIEKPMTEAELGKARRRVGRGCEREDSAHRIHGAKSARDVAHRVR